MSEIQIPPRIEAFLQRFEQGAAQTYHGQWELKDGFRLRVSLQGCLNCPLTAQYFLDTLAPAPAEDDLIDADDWLGLPLDQEYGLSWEHINQIVDAADDAAFARGEPLYHAIRARLLAACGLEGWL